MIKRETFVCVFLHYFCSVPMLIHLQEKINNLIQIDQVEREQFCSPPYVQDITVYPEKKKKKKSLFLFVPSVLTTSRSQKANVDRLNF